MKNILIGILALGLIASGCHSTKKVQKIENDILKKDTAQTIKISESPKIDSAAIVRDIMNKLVKRKIEYSSFNAKVNLDYEGAETSRKFTAYISLKKDSALYVKLTYSLYGVIANIYVNNDSVIIITTKGEKTIQYHTISYLQETVHIPFDFNILQDVLVGNPIFLDSNIVSYKSGREQLLVLMIGDIFKNLITLDNNDFKILHSKLDDVDDHRNRTCDITMSGYVPIKEFQFATTRYITVSEKSKLDITLEFKQYSFDEPLAYRFPIPKNYKVKQTQKK